MGTLSFLPFCLSGFSSVFSFFLTVQILEGREGLMDSSCPKNRFEAFDEPWKEQFNKGNENWEDKWGLMTIDRKLKPGLKIPDCGGKGV